MIEFCGELTGATKNFLLRKQIRNQSIVSAIVFLLFSIPLIILTSSDDAIWLLGFVPLTMLMIFSIITPSKKDQKKFMPIRVFVNLDEETIVRQCENGNEAFHMISTVKCVEDYGEWYHFEFNYSDRDMYFVCQKSLLTQGSIEEFENLFADKLIRVS